MEYFAGYGFNKSHSAAYALITYQTAYLKCHFPNEFMAALLTSEKGNSDKIVRYITECRRMGILILPPDVNESEKDFTAVDRGIRFGLAAIKNVGASAVDAMIGTRLQQGPFQSLLHFCQKVDLRKVNKRVMEGLIKAGAFDFTKVRRTLLLDNLEQTMQAGERTRKSGGVNQHSLFGESEETEQAGFVEAGLTGNQNETAAGSLEDSYGTEIARMEKEALGFYITSHPLAPYENLMKEQNATPTEALENLEESEKAICICGVLGEEKVVRTKKGEPMAYLRVEDLTGSVEVIVFPDLYKMAAPLIKQDQPVVITGTIDRSEHGIKFKATTLTLLKKGGSVATQGPSHSTENRASSLTLVLSSETVPLSMIRDLRKILEDASGPSPVILHIKMPEESVFIDIKTSVSVSPVLLSQIEASLGEGSVSIL